MGSDIGEKPQTLIVVIRYDTVHCSVFARKPLHSFKNVLTIDNLLAIPVIDNHVSVQVHPLAQQGQVRVGHLASDYSNVGRDCHQHHIGLTSVPVVRDPHPDAVACAHAGPNPHKEWQVGGKRFQGHESKESSLAFFQRKLSQLLPDLLNAHRLDSCGSVPMAPNLVIPKLDDHVSI